MIGGGGEIVIAGKGTDHDVSQVGGSQTGVVEDPQGNLMSQNACFCYLFSQNQMQKKM